MGSAEKFCPALQSQYLASAIAATN